MNSIPAPLVGGLLLSFATSSLLLDQGRILGCSGVAHAAVGRVLPSASKENAVKAKSTDWKVASVAGLVAGGMALTSLRHPLEAFVGQAIFDGVPTVGILRSVLAGLAVGAGTKLGCGCTSGHMLIGMARFSKRSIAATLTFFPLAFLTARLFSYPLPLTAATTLASLDLSQLTPRVAALILSPIAASIFSHRLFARNFASLVQSFSLSFLFSLGLALTGMLRPSKVLSFFYAPLSLPFATSTYTLPSWDPSLALVAIGGLLPNVIAWQYMAKGRSSPKKAEKWEVPTGGGIDRKLIFGSALFGIGWGLMGICPGPMLAVLGSGTGGSTLLTFAGAFAIGGQLVERMT